MAKRFTTTATGDDPLKAFTQSGIPGTEFTFHDGGTPMPIKTAKATAKTLLDGDTITTGDAGCIRVDDGSFLFFGWTE